MLVAVGPRINVLMWADGSLRPCGFYDAHMYITSINVIKDFVMVGDLFRSIHFLRWKDAEKNLAFLSRDYEPNAVVASVGV